MFWASVMAWPTPSWARSGISGGILARAPGRRRPASPPAFGPNDPCGPREPKWADACIRAWDGEASCLRGRRAAASKPVGKEAAVAMYEAYCVKCRAKREFEGTVVELKNGRKAAQGICPVCGTKVMRILGKTA